MAWDLSSIPGLGSVDYGGGGGGLSLPTSSGDGRFSWGDFNNFYQQIAQANQENPYGGNQFGGFGWQQYDMAQQQADEHQTFSTSRDEDEPKKYRPMNDFEKFVAANRAASDWVGSVVGNALFGTPDNPYTGEQGQQGLLGKPQPGEDINRISLGNIPRMASNSLGMLFGSIPDTIAVGGEALLGTPAQEADLDTGLIEDRKLNGTELAADIGYTGLSALSFAPGLGPFAKLGGGVAKTAGRGMLRAGERAMAEQAGESAFGKTMKALGGSVADAGDLGMRGAKSEFGLIERAGIREGKTGSELNPYRWGDAALGVLGSSAEEAAQEAGQTLMEEIRYDTLDFDDPNGSAKRISEGAFWGGMMGGIMGGGRDVAGTAVANSRANRGLDKYGNPLAPTIQPQATDVNFYKYYTPDVDDSDFAITPEMQKYLLEMEGNQEHLDHVGSNMKAVAGEYGQNPNWILYGVRGLRRQYQRNADNDEAIASLAGAFGFDKNNEEEVNNFREIMAMDDRSIVNDLNQRLQVKNAGKPSERTVLSNTRAPSTKYGSHQTYFVRGLTMGNTVRMAPSNATIFGGDLDGDTFSLFTDESDGLSSWEHLPTRKFMTPRAVPMKGTNGSEYIDYGTPEWGFVEGGITKAISDRNINGDLWKALGEVIKSHGIPDNKMESYRNRIIHDSFDISEEEKKAGITWKHKLAHTMDSIVKEQNEFEHKSKKSGDVYTVACAGDDLAADIMATLMREGSILNQAANALEALDLDSDGFMPELQSTYENIPIQNSKMPRDKHNLMQILVWFGKLNDELTVSESPMFRFKQSVAWGTKFVEMSSGLLKELGIDSRSDTDNIEEHIKWCMQMINTMNLPIDYVETAFKAKCVADISAALGINDSGTSKRFGAGLKLDEVQEAVTRIWNKNAELFDSAIEGQLTQYGEESIQNLVFRKTRIKKDDNGKSFIRQFTDLFGNMPVSHIAAISTESFANTMTLSGLFNHMADSPLAIDTSMFGYVDEAGDFNKLVQLGVGDFQGKEQAQISSAIKTIDQIKDSNAKFTVDKDTGYVSWDSIFDLEMKLWAEVIQNLLGVRASAYLAVWGADHLKNSGWGRFVFNRDPEIVKRALVAMGIRYNWRNVIHAIEDPDMGEQHILAAIDSVDLDNPLNEAIMMQVLIEGKAKYGTDGSMDWSVLQDLVDPTKHSYEHLCEKFDHSSKVKVRSDADLLLYYALDNGVDTITGSDISTRARAAKSYATSMKNNAMAQAYGYLADINKLMDGNNAIKPQQVVAAIRNLASSYPNVINPDAYVAAIHDSGFASGRAAEKAKSSRASSMHYDGVTNYLGGYSASFLRQLGVSFGMIDSDSSYNIAEAIRKSIFDPDYIEYVSVGNEGKIIEISQEKIFQAVNPDFKKTPDLSWGQLNELLRECPGLLCQIMPHTYEPLTADAESVSMVMLDTPVNMIKDYIAAQASPTGKHNIDLQVKKSRNRLLCDQDSPILVLGSIDHRYDSLVADTAAWHSETTQVVDDWSNALYKLACISDQAERMRAIDREIGRRAGVIGHRTETVLSDITAVIEDKRRAQLSKRQAKDMATSMKTNLFYAKLKTLVSKDQKKDVKKLSKEDAKSRSKQFDRRTKAAYKAEQKEFERQLEILTTYTEAFFDYLGIPIDVKSASLENETIATARTLLQEQVDENGNRIYNDDQIENLIKEVERDISLDFAKKGVQTRLITSSELDINKSGNGESVISKVEKYWRKRHYKRLQSDYFKSESDFEDWANEVRKAYNFTPVGVNKDNIAVDADGWTKADRMNFVKETTEFWNREILNAQLQRTYDIVGAGTASNELAMLEDARDFIVRITEEIAADPAIEKIARVDADKVTLPELSFSNKAISPHITAAGIELESGGNPIMSGQNAGSYQYITVLDLIEKDFECPSGTVTVETREEAIKLAESQANPLNYLNDDDSVSCVTVHDLTYGNNGWSDERIRNTRFAPQKDCLSGAACRIHNPLPVVGTSGSYIGGRFSLAQLCWYISEKKVFKNKKHRHVFDKISHIVQEAEKLKNMRLTFMDRNSMLTAITMYQERVAKHINKVFVSEQMNDEFGIDDARIIAQFSTPALKVTYRDAEGKIQHDTISKWSLSSDEAFLEELSGDPEKGIPEIDPNNILYMEPLGMSITDVCKKLTHDVIEQIKAHDTYGTGKQPDSSEISAFVYNGMKTWRGKFVDSIQILDFFKGMPGMKTSAKRRILYGSSPNAMQNFMDFGESMQRSGSATRTSALENAGYSNEDDRQNIKDYNKAIEIDARNWTSGTPIVIVKTASGIGKAEPFTLGSGGTSFTGSRGLHLKDNNFRAANVWNAILFPDVTDMDEGDKILSYWDDAKFHSRVLLIPEEALFTVRDKLAGSGITNQAFDSAQIQGTVKLTMNGSSSDYVVIDPNNHMPSFGPNMQTYIKPFEAIQMIVGYQDRGMAATGDSGSKWLSWLYDNYHMDFDEPRTIEPDVLFGNNRKLANSKMFILDLDDEVSVGGKTHRQAIKDEILARKSGDIKDGRGSKARIVMPNFQDTYRLADSTILDSINEYLSLDNLSPDGSRQGSVTDTQCMNIIGVTYNSQVYYIPIIYNRGGGPYKLDGVNLDSSSLISGKVVLNMWGKMSLEEGEGLKVIYPTVAYKTYVTRMSEEEERRAPKCGIQISVVTANGVEDLRTGEVYSGDTEDGRLIDAGFQLKLENLANLGKVVPRHYFMIYDADSNEWVVDTRRFKKLGISDKDLKRFLDWNNLGVWWDFVEDPTMRIHENTVVNNIMKKVALAALNAHMNPLFCFANIYGPITNKRVAPDTEIMMCGNTIRYIDFNHNLVYGVLDDNELERFFYAMDERFCYDGKTELGKGSNKERTTAPWVDRNGWLLTADLNENNKPVYRQGHVHFLRPTNDSSMLGVPSGKVKYGIQQIINEALIEGINPKSHDMTTLIDYAMARNGDPTNYIYGGKYATDFFKNKSDEELKDLSSKQLYNDLGIDKHMRRSHRPTQRRLAYRRKMIKEASWLDKPITFSGKDGTGLADLSSDLSDERAMLKRARDKFRNYFEPRNPNDKKLTDLEIDRLYKETTALTENDGHGVSTVTVKEYSDWVDAAISRSKSGNFAFELNFSVRGRPMLPAISSGLLDRMMLSDNFCYIDQRKYSRDDMIAFMLGRDETEDSEAVEGVLMKTLDSLNFETVQLRESFYTMVDVIGSTYGIPELSRPIGDFGVHLKDLIEEVSPVYDALGNTREYPQLKERRDTSEKFIKRQQDAERRRGYMKVNSYSSETGFLAQVKSKPRGTWWNMLSAVSRTWATVNASLGPSAVIQRFITQGQNRAYIFIDSNLAKGMISDMPTGIVIKNREAVRALGKNEHVQKLWMAMNMLTWSGEDLIALQNANSWEDIQARIDQRFKEAGWWAKFQAKAFNWASGGRVGVSWQIQNWADRLGAMMSEEEFPELHETIGFDGTTKFEAMLEENPENFVLDFLTLRDNNPYFFEANRARNWVVDREHAGQSVFGLALSKAFENHPIGRFMFISGFCKFPHYSYNIAGWFFNHFAPTSSAAYLLRGWLIHRANKGETKFDNYLAELGVERTQIYANLREALINDAIMMGSTALAGMLAGAMLYEPPDDEYYDEYAGNPEEWTVAGFRLAENWWLMDILGPFGAVCATWKSIMIGKPRFDLLQNWMTKALWSNPIIKASDVARTMLDPTEQYMDEYDNITEQYKSGNGPKSLSEMFLDDSITYGLNWFGQFVTPSIIREIFNSKEWVEHERSYKKVVNEKGELVDTNYLDSRIRKATKNNIVLGLMMDTFMNVTGSNKNQSGYTVREMPEVRIPDKNQKNTMDYFSLYNDDGSEKSEPEKQALAFEVLATLTSTEDMDALYKNGFVIPMETRIYASQMLNDMKQYETDQYNLWVQVTGFDGYLVGNGDLNEGLRIINATKAAYKDDLQQIDHLFDKLWSDEMNRGLQMYYRTASNYAQTASGEWYATGFKNSLSPLQAISPFITADGTYNAAFGIGTRNDGTMGRSGNWETPSAVVEGESAGGRNLVPIPSEKITKPKLSDFASDKNNGYSDTKAGSEYSNASYSDKEKAYQLQKELQKNYPSSYGSGSKSVGGGGRSGGGGGGRSGGGGGSRGSSAPNIYAPSISLPTVNESHTMKADKIIKPDYAYLRPDFETKGSREAYRRSDF